MFGIIAKPSKHSSNFEIGEEIIINPSLNWGVNNSHQIEKGYKILGMPDNGTFAEFVIINEKIFIKNLIISVLKKRPHYRLQV